MPRSRFRSAWLIRPTLHLMDQWLAGFESQLVPDLPLPFTPTLISLQAFDLMSSPVWWEAATNTYDHYYVQLILLDFLSCLSVFIAFTNYLESWDTKHKILLMDWFQLHVNLLRANWCQEVRESCSLCIHIYIFLYIVSLNTKNSSIYLSHRWEPCRYYHFWSEWTWE